MSNFRRKKILETLQNKQLSFAEQDEILGPYEDYLERVFDQFEAGNEKSRDESSQMSYRPKGLDMKRLEEEDSNLESDADTIRPPNLTVDGEFAEALADK